MNHRTYRLAVRTITCSQTTAKSLQLGAATTPLTASRPRWVRYSRVANKNIKKAASKFNLEGDFVCTGTTLNHRDRRDSPSS